MPSKRPINHPIKYDSIASQLELVDGKHQLTRSQLINLNLVSPLRSIQSRQGTHGSSTDNDDLLRLPHLLLLRNRKLFEKDERRMALLELANNVSQYLETNFG